MTTKATPFEQRANESARAFEAFKTYRDMGPDRSLEAVSRTLAKSVPLLKRWSARHNWTARAQAFDAHIDAMAVHAEAKVLKRRAGTWAARTEKQREEMYLAAQKLQALAENLLSKRSARKAGLAEIARALEVAGRLMALACGEPTERTAISGPDNGPLLAPPARTVHDLSREELARLMALQTRIEAGEIRESDLALWAEWRAMPAVEPPEDLSPEELGRLRAERERLSGQKSTGGPEKPSQP